ncbi:MAG TPA: T9SS type A sorting domain-containing protein, partial [Chryseolinea sp.]
MLRSFWIFLLFLSVGLQAQMTYVIDQTIPVQDEQGNELSLPWAGGLNAPHYNTMDLNGDNVDDLVLFDRMGDKIVTFLRLENKWQYAPEFEELFPDDITNWLLLRDFNCDGRKDIFTGDIFGINVFTNVTEEGSPLSWEQFTFYTGFGGAKSEALLTTGLSGNKINLQLQFDDLPSIVDADGDGDLDIFNLRFAGEGSIEFHQNFSKERYGTCDSLDFEKITQKWGGVTECQCGDFAFNNEPCGPTGGRTKHAAGKSLLMMDLNGDAAIDILFSESDCTNLYALLNEGTTDNPEINAFETFPEVSPVDFLIFPAAFYEDVDFDGRKDLISTPNIFAKTPEILNADLTRSNWVYKNSGTDATPVFSFSTESFLQDQMIDVGDNAVPAFIDYDGDGDQDLFVSQNNTPSSRATIRLFENSGTTGAPEFTLVEKDAFGFSGSTLYNLKIQFADLNHDAKTDLVFTGTDFVTGQTKLYYLPNTSNTGLDFTGQEVQQTNVFIVSSENITVIDVDEDGFQDLLIGKSNGALQYWRNQQAGVPSFTLQDESFLNITPNIVRQNISGTGADVDSDGKLDLILADQRGILNIIPDFRNATTVDGELTELVFNSILEGYSAKNLGGRIWPVTANIFNTTKPAIVVGNNLGGLYVLRNDEGQSLPEHPTITVFPNPVETNETFSIQIDRPAQFQVFSSLGQVVTSSLTIPASGVHTFRVPPLASGVYFLRFNTQGKLSTRRLVIV